MYKFSFILTAFIALSACKTTEQQNAEDMANDKQRCQSLGFAAGSQAMADCMNTAAATRAADKDRQEAQSEAWQAQQQANFRAWQQKVDNNNSYSSSSMSQRNSSNSMANVPPSSMPSAAAIPGMKCSGSGDNASCDALTSSDSGNSQ